MFNSQFHPNDESALAVLTYAVGHIKDIEHSYVTPFYIFLGL